MFSVCSRSTAWLLALMKSADRFLDHVHVLGWRLLSWGFHDHRSDRSVITTHSIRTIS
jgi:hypothetical protein